MCVCVCVEGMSLVRVWLAARASAVQARNSRGSHRRVEGCRKEDRVEGCTAIISSLVVL